MKGAAPKVVFDCVLRAVAELASLCDLCLENAVRFDLALNGLDWLVTLTKGLLLFSLASTERERGSFVEVEKAQAGRLFRLAVIGRERPAACWSADEEPSILRPRLLSRFKLVAGLPLAPVALAVALATIASDADALALD